MKVGVCCGQTRSFRFHLTAVSGALLCFQAHAKVWHTYNSRFRPHQQGHVSITLGSHWMQPLKGQASLSNVERCQESLEAVLGWFAEPIHGSGDYPTSLKEQNPGLLPEFTEAEKQQVRGTADFFALSFGPNNLRPELALDRFGQQVSLDLRKALNWIKLEYGNPRVLITENGWFSNATVGTNDTVAIYLMKRFINHVLQGEQLRTALMVWLSLTSFWFTVDNNGINTSVLRIYKKKRERVFIIVGIRPAMNHLMRNSELGKYMISLI